MEYKLLKTLELMDTANEDCMYNFKVYSNSGSDYRINAVRNIIFEGKHYSVKIDGITNNIIIAHAIIDGVRCIIDDHEINCFFVDHVLFGKGYHVYIVDLISNIEKELKIIFTESSFK